MSSDRLEALFTRWSDGSLSPDEIRELEVALLADPAARRLFRRHANLDTGLHGWAEERATPTPWLGLQTAARRPSRWPIAIAAAILLLAGAAWFWTDRHSSKVPVVASAERTAQGCAVLTHTLDAQFPQGSHASGETLPPGRFRLTEGWAQIEFFSGASLIVEGAAELEIVSAWEARCVSGKVRVRVPPAARGFRLEVPGMKLVDLGTEFAVNASAEGQRADVHVFDGEVIARAEGHPEVSLRQGQSVSGRPGATMEMASLDPKQFLRVGQLQELVAQRQEQRFDQWQTAAIEQGKDPRVVAGYLFRHFPQWERLVKNAAAPDDKSRNGGAVGAVWTQGRWPQKDALDFQRPGARVRLNIDGNYDALTFTCWAKVDAIDRKYNALLLTDGYDAGEPHWQIFENGSLMFSLAYPDPAKPTSKRNQIYYSPPVFTEATLGHWHHLAVTYDNQSGIAIQYVDGREVSREVSAFHTPGRPITLGPCELGNWGLPTDGHKFPIRNLHGCLDEFFIYRTALTGEEIHALYEAGKPD
jgi:hypothetical protein